MKHTLPFLAIAVVALAASGARAADSQETKPVSFQKDIGPLFEQSCIRCHGSQKAKAGLRLDSFDAAIKGGKDGKVIQPGDSAKSRLVKFITKKGPDGTYSHPPRKPLKDEEISLIKDWIDQGAK